MFSNFQPASHRRFPVSTRELRSLCRTSRSLEEIALSWCTDKKSIFISRDIEHAPDYLTCVFLIKKRIIGTVTAPIDSILSEYPVTEPVDQHFTFDQATMRPEEKWFRSRQQRLGLSFSKELGANIAPSESIGELILSYCLSAVGYAEMRGIARDDADHHQNLLLDLVCVHKHSQTGWSEQFLINRQQLSFTLQFRSAMLSGVMH
jgi:hypothetical protein